MNNFTPHGWHTVTPRIFTGNVAGLVGFLKAVFNASGEYRVGMPAEIRIGDSIVMISDGGGRRETMPAFLYVYVEDADETYRLAVQAGAEPLEQPIDTPYGDRRATVLDSWGNTWQIATRRKFRIAQPERRSKTREPTMIQDAYGHHLSGATEAVAATYDQAVRAFNLVHGDAVGLFDEAREAAPDFAMAHLGKAWVFAVANDPGLMTRAKELVDTARPLRLNEREQAHLAALTHLVQGARAAAVAVLDRHLMRYPFDLVAHQAAALMDGFLGRFRWVRDRSARALPFWSKDQPGYATLLAFHAFGAEEAGDYTRAEDESREAAEREPSSFWPHHTVAHVMEMTGRPEDGLGWMAAREKLWSTPGHMNQVHIWWHKALFHLELGQYDAALALYDGPMRATQRPVSLSLTNATALLWRIDTLGCDIGDRWREQAELWQGHADGKCLVFADIHAAMAELRSGEASAVERRLAWMRETAASDAEAADLYRTVGIPIVEGLAAFHRGAHAQAVELLLPVRFDLWQIGGSYAQRDVVDWTLTEAAIRAGQRDVALSLAHERLATRPRSAPNRRFRRRAEAITA